MIWKPSSGHASQALGMCAGTASGVGRGLHCSNVITLVSRGILLSDWWAEVIAPA